MRRRLQPHGVHEFDGSARIEMPANAPTITVELWGGGGGGGGGSDETYTEAAPEVAGRVAPIVAP